MEVSGKRVETEDTSEPVYICEPCQRGKGVAKSVGLCRECDEYMCQTCFDHHLKAKICMAHTLLGDLKSSVSIKGSFQDVERCKYHYNETVKYYCRKHDTVGCGDCMLSGGHNACQPEHIKNVAKNFKNEKAFQDLLKQAEEIEMDKSLTASLNQDSLRKTKELSEKAVNEVRKFRADINNSLDKAEAIILSKIKTVALKNDEKLSTMEKAIESISVELEEVKMKMNTEIHGTNALFINAIGCKSQLNRIAQSLVDVMSKAVLKEFSFNPDESLYSITTSAKSLGSLRFVDHEKTVTTRPEKRIVSGLASSTENNSTKEKDGSDISDETIGDCVICMDQINNPKTLKCGHRCCGECIDEARFCPTCGSPCRVPTDTWFFQPFCEKHLQPDELFYQASDQL